MAPTTQKALLLPKKQGQWIVGERSVAVPGPKDVLIKITATALNPVDWKIQTLGFVIENYPWVGGQDGAGIIEEIGSEVTNVAKGDTVFFQGWPLENTKATFQQYAVVAAEIVAKVPKNITIDQAASIPLGLATVASGLWGHHPQAKSAGFPAPWEEGGTNKFAGKPVLIIGGSSSVGQYAIQLTKLSGFSPIITTSSLRHEEYLKYLGATHVLDRTLSSSAIESEVSKLVCGKPVELVYDAISHADTQQLAYDILAPGGHLIIVLPDLVPAEKKKAGDNKTVVSVAGSVQMPENRALGVALYSRLTEWLETGKLVPNRVEVLPGGLVGIIDGLERMKKDLKALVLPAVKGEWVVSEVSVPTPGPKEILVKIIAAGLNPADWKIQAYGIEWVPYPFIGGSDAAGVVEEVGAEVTNLTKGDKVFYQAWFNTRKSAFQQYGIVPAEIAAKIPDNITFDQAASIPLGLNTVAIGLYNHTPNTKSVDYPAPWEQGGTTKFAGKPAFVLGGSSTVGQYAIQLARLSGFSPIITTSSLRHEEFLKSIGATHIIDRTLPSDTIQAEVTKLAGHKPVEYVYDSISSAETQQLGYEVLAPGGDLLLVNPQAIPAEKKKTSDNKKILNVFADVQAPENRDVVVGIWSHITELFATGKLVPGRVEVLPNGLAGIPDGLVRLQKEQVSGQKLIAHPQETP